MAIDTTAEFRLQSAVVRLAELFTDQVSSQPNAIALRHRGTDLTFSELDHWSTQLANHLREARIGPGNLAALAVDRSPAMVAAVLAVIKVGAGYLALDPDTPVRRQRAMVGLARPSCMLAKSHLDRLPTLDVPRVFIGDVPNGPVLAQEWSLPETDDTVFQVAPTSGTTGMPRLVRIGYRSVLNRLEWMWRDYPFPESSTVAVHKSPALVASPWEILGGLLRGVPSVVFSREEVLDPALFAGAIVEKGITHLYLTPHLLTGLLDEAARNGGLQHRMRLVTSGADTLSPQLARRFHAAFPNVRLLNLYGMTETASNVAAYDTAHLTETATRVPVGRPVAGATITVRDRMLRPVPIGVAGEICVAGPPVALGYLGDDDLTAERFVQQSDGAVLYRTGDRGRWLSDGMLEVTGRVDNQIKVRGYRVELEEVETVLRCAGPVTDAGICVTEKHGDAVLTGCLTANDELDLSSLRAYLRDRLPDYMVPTRLLQVAALPRGSNGKLDRSALADLAQRAEAARPATQAKEYEPADPQEQIVVRCWTEVLGVAPEDTKQSFFDAGGHSMLAITLAGKLNEALAVRVPLRDLLEEPTVAGIAATVKAALGDGAV
jgi:amino acid adenylation domain-containing protein